MLLLLLYIILRTQRFSFTLSNLLTFTTFSEIHQKLLLEHSNQHQKQNYFYPKTLTTDKNSKLNTSLNKHRLSQPNDLKNKEKTLQHLPSFNFNIRENSKQQNYAPFYNYFFVTRTTSSKELKQTYWRSLNSFTQLPTTSSA